MSQQESWPFREAAKVAERVPHDKVALFETGYGPSGLPHVGTFAEVARTGWVRRAYTTLTGRPALLVCFSDDMDGLRKVPGNVPNQAMLSAHLGMPLHRVPDPFGTHESLAHHCNARLRGFLDDFGFEYGFMASSDMYRAGRFDAALIRVLERHEGIVALVAPTLGAERRATYSPFMPINPDTGQVEQVAIDQVDVAARTIRWTDPNSGKRHETSILGGACKLQWKADWGMRWAALGVDYEMSGKDLIDSVKLATGICRAIGGTPPVGFTYELFLDEKGRKHSKSSGNGLPVEGWLAQAPAESLARFVYHRPERAKRVLPEGATVAMDEFLAEQATLPAQCETARRDNPAWHILAGREPERVPVTFGTLVNVASAARATEPSALWTIVRRLAPEATPANSPLLNRMIELASSRALADAGAPRTPVGFETAALADLAVALRASGKSDAEAIQFIAYEVGKRHPFPTLRDWFRCLYSCLFGRDDGPRFGQFAELYGIEPVIRELDAAVARAEQPPI